MEVHLRWQAHWLLALFTVHLYRAHSQTSLHIHFTKAPPKITSQTTAAFEFAINDNSGRDSCENCSIHCKLDEEASIQDCDSRGNSYVNLLDGLHIFQVFVVASKNRFSFQYSWTVDTMPPTATLRAGSGFTNAKHVSLNILFSEPCYPSTNSTCSGILCNLQVKGLGTAVPSTLSAIRPGLEYTVMIKLSEIVLDGRVVLALAKGFCTDWAGNKFQRNETSSFVIHFDRRKVFANLWTEIPEFEVDINHQKRTIRATNNPDLSINLDFSESMINTTTEILSQVTASIGKLIQTTRKTHGNRKFSFQITNVPSLAVVTIMLQTKALLSRFGNRVSVVNPVTFLFDNLRPKIKLSTVSRTKTEERHAPIIIQFSEPVLVFDSSDLVISGGRTSRFEEISSTIYYLEVVFIGDVLLSVLVPQNRVHDVAGNPNYASNVLRFRHYAVPSISVALYSFTTAGVLATAFTSGALAISSTCLATAGVLDSWATSLAMTDPSRNFLGLISHIQMFAFSKWMAVSLPVDYYETVKGLQWSIPQRELPWEKQQAETKRFAMEDILLGLIESEPFIVSHRRVSSNFKTTDQYTQSIGFVKCQLETKSAGSSLLQSYPHQHRNKNLSEGEKHAFHRNENIAGSFSIVKQPKSLNQTLSERIKHYCNLWAGRQQKFGANASVFGPDLSADEYSFYFKDKALYVQETVHLLSKSHYTGWQDFARNLFWLGVGGGTLTLLHALLLVYLRWKTKESLRGSLSIPRLEVSVLLLALPCISQASAFVIKGGTTKGLIVGVLLLAFPAASLLSMVLFIVVAVIIREYVQYQEVKPFHLSPPWYQRILAAILGTNSTGKWVRKEGLPASFLPRFGLLIEDRRGPVKLTINARTELDRDEWVDSGSNGIGRMRPSPDIQADNLLASKLENAFGVARASYLILDISRRVTLGIIFGAYPTSDKSWIQLVVAAAFTTIQLLYLVIFKPYIRRGVQLVESLSLMCEVGIFFAGLGLLSHAHPYEDYQPLGIVMLTLFGISFTGQLANEWYALLEQLLSLSPAQDTSFIGGLKMFVRGLFLPFIAHGKWEKFIALPSQPTGLVPVSHRTSDLQKGKASVKSSISAEAAASVRGLPSFFGEVGFSQHHAAQGAERQKGKSTELKLLQKLAKASFPIDADASWPSSSIEDAPPVSSLQAETVDRGKQILTLVTSEQHSFNS